MGPGDGWWYCSLALGHRSDIGGGENEGQR